MSALSGAHGQTIAARPVTGARLHGGMLWLTGLAGAFVLVEPSPYEVIALATAVLYSVTGLTATQTQPSTTGTSIFNVIDSTPPYNVK